jgi:hypothetical protein
MQMPIFQGVLNVYPLANLLPKGPTDDLPGIRPKAVCGDVQCNPPSAISHVWRRGGGGVHYMLYRLRFLAFRQLPALAEGECDQ